MAKKIAVVMTNEFEDSEYAKPAEAFKQAGHELTVIEKEKGKTVTGKHGEVKVTVDASIDEVKPEDFDALFIPGGFSPDILRADDRFVDFAKAFMDAKKTGVCDLPWSAALDYRKNAEGPQSDRLQIDPRRSGKRRREFRR